MLLSMTGFGKATAESENKKITAEIKSLNSKQMDLTVRLPHIFRESEADIRADITRALIRGKADIVVNVESAQGSADVSLNVAALAQYKDLISKASAALGIPEPADWYSVLLRFPDIMHADAADTVTDEETAALRRAVADAVEQLTAHRRAEGIRLEEFFRTRIANIAALLDEVPRYEGERLTRIRTRIEDGLSKISAAEYDKGRLEQEMIFYIEKLDISEEKQRLTQHLRYFIETLELPEPGQGKKLGFIAQEMGREINTLGSKSNHAEMQIIVVKMKDELEQIKEQVLNVL